ncbi:hypothetical protein AAIH37_08305 [Pseudomonas aeruginosa]|uniref:hypothetical protein n=1 Tax=Pseudomonas aeruginosa TaxID=287 RepID=UPI0031B7CC20
MTASKIQMDQIRSTSATVTGENIRAGSQKKSSLSPAEGLQGASPDATCTCPSGNGSLRHPCPAHPAVEQAGGDERAVDGKPRATKCPDCGEGDLMPGDLCACGYETDPAAGYACSECDGSGDGYVGEVCRECDGSGWFVTPEQARAALAQPSPTTDSRPAEWSSYDPTWVVDFIRDNSIFNADLIERMLEYATRPAGDVPQAEQAEAERPEGPTEDELEAAGLGYPLHKEEAVKLWYSGFRSEVITVLEAWEAIGHDIGMNPDKGELLDSLRYMLEKCEAHDAALARVAELERQQPVAWMHDQPNRVDVIHRDVKDLLQRVPGSSRGIYRPLDVSEHYTIPLYAAPVAQAQHSVPEISGIGRDAEHPRAVVLYLRTEPTDDDLRAIHDGLRSLAAAPGKEGV